MIPYIHVSDFPLGPIPLHPFGLLVAIGVLIGTWITTYRARKIGYDVDLLNSFITWMLVGGFIGGHVLDEIFYHPDEIAKNPLSLLFLWQGLSSFGGFVGALIGIILWKYFEWLPRGEQGQGKQVVGRLWRRPEKLPLLPFADIVLSVFPIAWIFGRGGCSIVHDHPGARAPVGSLLAVQYGPGPKTEYGPVVASGEHLIEIIHGNAPRWDLGLLEWMFTVVLSAIVVTTWRKKLPTGTYICVVALAYAPVRFVMDFLRITSAEGKEADIRYGQLTFAQYCCIALFVFGLVLVWHIRNNQAKHFDPADLVMAQDEEEEEEEESAAHSKG
jgi:phosphatidylglycerol:prolipoprotein diacylglycerol transferase